MHVPVPCNRVGVHTSFPSPAGGTAISCVETTAERQRHPTTTGHPAGSPHAGISLSPCGQRQLALLLRAAQNLGCKTSAGPSASNRGSSMCSALTMVARVHGGTRIACPGLKPVFTSNAAAATARAWASLRALTITGPRCELASQFGSSRSTGVSDHIGIVRSLCVEAPQSRISPRCSLTQIKVSVRDRRDGGTWLPATGAVRLAEAAEVQYEKDR